MEKASYISLGKGFLFMPPKSKSYRFSKKTLEFLVKAGRQKNPHWLENNLEEYEAVLRTPFIHLAETVKAALWRAAPGYHFPSKGLARIKRPDFKVARGQNQYKDWISMIAARPSLNRFESNPHLFFGLFPNEETTVLLAGGLWQPTPRQTRRIREAISTDSAPFHELFADDDFKDCFKDGFFMQDRSLRVPRGFPEHHEDIEWLKLKKFVVYKKISIKDFSSTRFSDKVVRDFRQALRLNELLDRALSGKWPS